MANDAVATRTVMRVVRGMPTSDGAGVKLTRVIGQSQLPDLDPFLLLDEFGTDKAEDYIAGFPDHPHRGFETVTYMLDGRMRVIRKAGDVVLDRKSTRLNSSHGYISYAVFCLKKKKSNCVTAISFSLSSIGNPCAATPPGLRWLRPSSSYSFEYRQAVRIPRWWMVCTSITSIN